MMDAGRIQSFKDIFIYLPKTVVAKDLGMNNTRINKLIDHIDNFTLRDLFLLAEFIGIGEAELLNLVTRQYLEDKKSKKTQTPK